MTRSSASERLGLPPGIDVFRADELDPVYGRRDQWIYRGTVGERSVIRAGFSSQGAACRAAWTAYRSATLMDAEVVAEEPVEPERHQPLGSLVAAPTIVAVTPATATRPRQMPRNSCCCPEPSGVSLGGAAFLRQLDHFRGNAKF